MDFWTTPLGWTLATAGGILLGAMTTAQALASSLLLDTIW